jgi:sugar/nucleoside kinase (ribokinase family)
VAGALVLDGLDGRPTAQLLAEARRRGVRTSLDPVFDASGRWDRLLAALPLCDLVTPGVAEAEGVTGEREPSRAAARLRELGAAVAAVTLGPDGCYVSGEGFEGFVPAPSVDAVDGTGAGDAFAGGFLYGLLAGWPLEQCARFANSAGALATTAVGAFDGVGTLADTLALTAGGPVRRRSSP